MTAEVYTYIGAGGKTTSLFARARQERDAGHRVAVVTTTHMKRPAEWFIPADLPEGWQAQWQRDGIIVVGWEGTDGKITWPGEDLYLRLCADADVVLVEGDGSRRLPLKVMGTHEPVIPANTSRVYCLAGLSALGHTVRDICFRWELLDLDPEAVVTEFLAAHIIEAGCLARIGRWKDRTTVILNQADDERRRLAGKRILNYLSRPGILTTYPVEMRETK
ncbi:MAG: putative selenium-dependent hydroxylase accessory protein YqeC [Megasphaera sp.]|uniref:selenium cofactor biosynthesis protein YqeC n=1 Tax=Megasphaera sp. TaxID=2023260 RepID=UPI0025C457BE|nr:selenium cofactor biosynthesis protein YqeC [Megasphaera sp.]MCF0153740.1 putative selenium-dependent hydroxylase accessory protein YqeC [Megasphaera sp.]MCI7600982.1 putative selenium-dependent hydroxylase accessory protein YqeC [Megasphaera sp.]